LSERFYQKFLSLFSGFVMLLILFLVAIMVLLGYLISQNLVLYVGYCAILTFSAIYGTRYYMQFKDFKENLYLFIPQQQSQPEPLEPLNLEVEDLPLKVCVLYRNGASLNQIKREFGFSHVIISKRMLVKGLDTLLKCYEKHEGKVNLYASKPAEKERCKPAKS